MSTGADSLGFTYTLDVNKLTGPAEDAARALGLLNNGLNSTARALAKLEGSGSAGSGLGRIAKATEHAAAANAKWESSSKKAFSAQTDGWTKAQSAADKANQAMGRAQAAAVAMDQRRTASAEKESSRRIATAEREAAKIAKAQEKAARSHWYGGEKSFFGSDWSGTGGLIKKQHESQIGGLASSIAGGLTPLGMTGMVASGASAAFGLVTDVVSAGASLAYNFGKMAISAQSMRESSVAGFSAIYGSKEVGNKLFDEAREIGQLTKFETRDAVNIYNTLAANNFKQDELKKYAWAISDVETMREGKGLTFMNALARIRGNKTATFGNLQSAGLQGPGIENVFNELADIRGMSRNTTKMQWQKLMRGGSVSREQALDAVTQAVAHKYDTKTGQLGEASKEQGMGTWGGLLSNIGEGLENTLRSKVIAASPALNNFKTLLQSVGELFNENTERGGKFAELVGKFVDDVFIPFGGLEGKGGNILDKLLAAGGRVETWFKGVMTDIRKGIKEAFDDDGAGIGQLAAKVGFSIGAGILKGIFSELPGGRYSGIGQGSDDKAWRNLADDLSIGAPSEVSAPYTGTVETATGGVTVPIAGKFASGGEVPGPYGSPQLVLAHAGEIIPGLHGERMGDAQRAYGGGGGDVHYHTWYVTAADADEFTDKATRMFEMMVRNPTNASSPG